MIAKFSAKLFLLICTSLLLIHVQFTPANAAGSRTSILLDGYPLSFPAEPQLINGNTMVPFRAIAEAMGISVEWIDSSQSIFARKTTNQGSTEVLLQLNNPVALVNGQPVLLAASPVLVNDYTMIPLRMFSEQFGAQVNWNSQTRTVSLTSPPTDLYTLAFYAISSYSERQLIPSFDSVAFGWSRIDETGNLTLKGKDFYWPQAANDITPEGIVQEAHHQGTTPYLMVFATDGKGELTRLLETPALSDKAIETIVSVMQTNQFGGVVLDFEGLGLSGDIQGARQSYNQFVGKLSKQLRALDSKLSLVLHPLNGAYKGYDYQTLGTLADDLIIMAYDYGAKGQPENMDKVNQAIQLAVKQVSKEKLILGISMGSENEQSINSKVGLAKRYQLKGIALWRLGLVGQPALQQLQNSVDMKHS